MCSLVIPDHVPGFMSESEMVRGLDHLGTSEQNQPEVILEGVLTQQDCDLPSCTLTSPFVGVQKSGPTVVTECGLFNWNHPRKIIDITGTAVKLHLQTKEKSSTNVYRTFILELPAESE